MADASAAGAALEPTGETRRGPLAAFTAPLAAEGERRILWAPVWFGSGIALYFSLTDEPARWSGALALAVALAVAALLRRHRVWRSAALCLALAAGGFALIAQTTHERAGPMLDHRVGATVITGRVIDIDTLERGWRIV